MRPQFAFPPALQRLHNVLPPLAGLAILALVAAALGGGDVVRRLAQADPLFVTLAVLAVQPQIVLSALRWRFISQRLGQPLPIGRAVGEYYLATLLNQVLPGGVAGDAVRVVRAAREGGDGRWTGRAGQAVVLDRLSGQIVLFAVAGFGLLLAPVVFGVAPPGGLGLLVVLGLAGGLGLAAYGILRFMGERAARFRRAFRPVMAETFLRRGAWGVQGATSAGVVGSYLAVFALAAAAVGTPLGLAATVLLVPLVLLSMLLPLSVGGWGLREAAAAAILPIAGLRPDAAFAASVVYGIASLAGALPGLVVLLRHALAGRRAAA
ncbi:lysylphosphatidylglycerol synthase transmembrane domain-containing protein [Aureimonas sp. SK2]|uniref:lysylphosphatidylglycerol synthase transmembrane domain-containing protein n=1 Tax=Aureimonas sp. SK2 TaxID=3015992 RepID=UPI002443AC19|nr:lysylphosphatidylglycerol synthase transmembrane domain-containing protein [Aureimonas sp. SK2]